MKHIFFACLAKRRDYGQYIPSNLRVISWPAVDYTTGQIHLRVLTLFEAVAEIIPP